MIGIFCLALGIFSMVYVPWRLSRLFAKKGAFLPLVALVAVVLFGYLAILRTGFYARPSLWAAIPYDVLGVLLIFHTYLFVALLVLHPFNRWLRARRGKMAAGAALGLSLCLALWGLQNALSFRVTELEVGVPGLARPITIMHAPDLHLGAARGRGFLERVLAEIDRYQPDLVIYNGDLVDSNLALDPALFEPFKGVKAPQYFTTGNHEYYVDTPRALELIQGAGIRYLRSENVDLGGANLLGLLYMNADKGSHDSHRVNDLFMDEELPKIARDPGKPTILVHHSPVGMRYAREGGASVMLTGHTHGGQVFPGTLLIRLMFPYYKGRYDFDGMTLLVSQGVGTFGPIQRLGTFGELQFITLVPGGPS